MGKIYRKDIFLKLIRLILFGVGSYYCVILLVNEILFAIQNKSLIIEIFHIPFLIYLTIQILYLFFDELVERVIITNEKIILKKLLKTKEITISNVKGFKSNKYNIYIHSKDEKTKLIFSSSLKNDKPIYKYLIENFKDLNNNNITEL